MGWFSELYYIEVSTKDKGVQKGNLAKWKWTSWQTVIKAIRSEFGEGSVIILLKKYDSNYHAFHGIGLDLRESAPDGCCATKP